MTRLLLSFFFLFLLIPSVYADEPPLPTCGPATDFEMSETATRGLCNIYTRQLEYREKRLEFVEKMQKRREDYAKPRVQAYKTYQEDLQAMYDSMDEEEEEEATENEDSKMDDEEAPLALLDEKLEEQDKISLE